MSLELQSLAVFGLSPKAQQFFLFFFFAEIGGTFLVPWLPDQQEEIFKHGCLTEFPMGIFEVFFTRLLDIHNWSRYRSTLVVVSTVGPVLMR